MRKYRQKRTLQKNIVIVCEGYTERNYFKYMKKEENMISINLEPVLSTRTDPMSILSTAEKEYKKKLKIYERKNEFNKYCEIFCVLDKDTISHLETFEQKRKELEEKGIKIILSNPCFEMWYLLHFEYSTAQYENCNKLKRKLERNHMKDYKEAEEYYAMLKGKQNIAIKNAKALLKYNVESKTESGSFTKMHLLIEEILK